MDDNEKDINYGNQENHENHNNLENQKDQPENNETYEIHESQEVQETQVTEEWAGNEKNDEDNSHTAVHENPSNEINFVLKESDFKKDEKKNKRKGRRLTAAFVAVALVASMLGGVAGGALVNYQYNINSNAPINGESANNAQKVKIDLADNVYFAVAVAEKAQKTVVGITTESTKNVNTIWGPQSQKSQMMGSGMIVDPNGYILTNAHVIGDGVYDKITVSLIDGSNSEGKVLWYDTTLDMAVVKIEKTGLPAVELGDSDALMVGEPVVAIGNPMTLELERTVTQGVVSGLNRSITFENGITIKPLIQTDASINSGNSGGPLFNAKGEVIGINTAKMNSAEGLGFSIPINTAKEILQQVIGQGSYSSLYVGIKGIDVQSYERLIGVDMTAESGVVAVEIVKDSPAVAAGLAAGDVITAIDGKKVEDMNDLKRILYDYKENDVVKISINRNGEEKTIDMTLKVKPKDYQ